MKFRSWFESEGPLMSARKVRYAGIILDEGSRKKLIQALQKYLEPLLQQGWQLANKPPPGLPPEPLPHHMTIVAGQPLPDDLRDLLGTEQPMVAVKWGQSDQAAAVAVTSPVRSMNATPHITVAVSPTGKPFHSNQISEWVPLEAPIQLVGVVQEV